jgi:hypothetical protein
MYYPTPTPPHLIQQQNFIIVEINGCQGVEGDVSVEGFPCG